MRAADLPLQPPAEVVTMSRSRRFKVVASFLAAAALAGGAFYGLSGHGGDAQAAAAQPDPRMLVELMDEFQVAPARTLMVGDTTHDLQLARNAGTASVAVSFGAHEPATFDGHGARHVAHSTADLQDWLLRHG